MNEIRVITLTEDQLEQLVKRAVQEAQGNGNAGELVTPEELAEALRVPISWVYEQNRMGKLPTYKVGRYLRLRVAEVLKADVVQRLGGAE